MMHAKRQSYIIGEEADAAAGFSLNCTTRNLGNTKQARRLLRTLRDSATTQEAEDTMRAIHCRVTPDGDSEEEEKSERAFSKALFRTNGIPIIIAALTEWGTHMDFCSFATIVLMNMAYYEPKSGQCIVDLRGIQLLIDTALYHNDLDLTADTLLVFNNIADSEAVEIKEDVAIEECISFVLDQMHDHSEDDILQRNACAYLENICCVPSIRYELESSGVSRALSRTAERFRGKNSDVVLHAKNALSLLYGKHSCCLQNTKLE
eukprot:scaffold2830_cov131-Cylindrotheca_fusiformis.AAC.55